MKKKKLLLSAILILVGTCAANAENAQKAYTYVQQNGQKIASLGTAAFDLAETAMLSPTVEFDADGNAVMKMGGNTVAKLPMKNNGELVVEFETTVAATDLNKVSKTFSKEYATLYSPFQLQVPESSTVEVYAPTYDTERHVLTCNSTTKVAASAVIPTETALILKNAGTIDFTISVGVATNIQSDLSGSSLTIDVPTVESGNTLYTLGSEATTVKYGFFEYTGTKLNPGLAWLVAETISENAAKYIPFSIGDDDDTTAVSELEAEISQQRDGKFIENGRVVIMKNNKKYNLNGQEVK